MKAFASVIAGTVSIFFGGSLVLFGLPAAFVQHPSLHGASYWLGVADSLFGPWTGRLAGGGLVLLFAGVVLSLWAAFPPGREMTLSRAGRVCLFWSLAALGTSALLGMLLGITLCTLGLD